MKCKCGKDAVEGYSMHPSENAGRFYIGCEACDKKVVNNHELYVDNVFELKESARKEIVKFWEKENGHGTN